MFGFSTFRQFYPKISRKSRATVSTLSPTPNNPEITAIPLAAAPDAYAAWLREATTPQD